MSKFFFLTVFSLFLANCSSSNTSPKIEINQNKAADNSVNIVPNTAVNKTAAASVNQPTANIEPPLNGNVSIQNFSVSKDNFPTKKGDRIVKGGVVEPIAPHIETAELAAPDNSVIISGMNAKGQPVETRTFKNHPVLVKIERTDLNDGDIKIYLKNGKIAILPESLANNFLTARASDILKVVGGN